jgi:hypothetical protein
MGSLAFVLPVSALRPRLDATFPVGPLRLLGDEIEDDFEVIHWLPEGIIGTGDEPEFLKAL